MSERDRWQWVGDDENFGWRRLDAEDCGYAGELVEPYLVCVKSEAVFDVSGSPEPVPYVDQPRDVICGLIPGLGDYADWEASGVWINICLPKRPVWVHVIIVILKELHRILIIEIKLTVEQAEAFDDALGRSA